MDVSAKSIVCTTLDENGNTVRKDSIENSFEKLGGFLDRFYLRYQAHCGNKGKE
jgi:hypothetical protein